MKSLKEIKIEWNKMLLYFEIQYLDKPHLDVPCRNASELGGWIIYADTGKESKYGAKQELINEMRKSIIRSTEIIRLMHTQLMELSCGEPQL